jgi:hypothetical protein
MAMMRTKPWGTTVALITTLSVAVVAWRTPPRPVSPVSPARTHAAAQAAGDPLFRTAESCLACHNGLRSPQGEDVSIGTAWRATMMANSSRDPYWQASVRREVADHPDAREEIEDECSTCHMPMSRYESRTAGGRGEVFSHLATSSFGGQRRADSLALDGVSCALCHQIGPERLGTPESFVGGFVVDNRTQMGKRPVFGPFEVDSGRAAIMHSSSEFVPTQGTHIRDSELCATCHTLITTARGPGGHVIGRLPEQMPYQEWRHSSFSTGSNPRTCQSCHMPAVGDSTAIASVWGQPRAGLARHEFLGGNFFMLRMLDRYRDTLGVEALPEELQRAATRTVEHLATSTARVTVENARVVNGRLEADVVVQNLAGHKLPTGYPSRRAWLHVSVLDDAGTRVFESGALGADGAIAGNDADADASAFEPHHREITRADQVQIYESMMGDAQGRVTTGLISATRFLKDNRVLPAGFDKRTAAPDIAVVGAAIDDADFAGGSDRVRYAIDVSRVRAGSTLRVEIELRYQPIAFRWAKNLGGYESREVRRFTSYYDAMSSESATVLARAATTVR